MGVAQVLVGALVTGGALVMGGARVRAGRRLQNGCSGGLVAFLSLGSVVAASEAAH